LHRGSGKALALALAHTLLNILEIHAVISLQIDLTPPVILADPEQMDISLEEWLCRTVGTKFSSSKMIKTCA
jgi:hypothetical protein